MTTEHGHSSYVAGCTTCERDMLFFRLTNRRKVTRATADEAWSLWRADDMAGLQALATRAGIDLDGMTRSQRTLTLELGQRAVSDPGWTSA